MSLVALTVEIEKEAVSNACNLALRVLADKIEHGERLPGRLATGRGGRSEISPPRAPGEQASFGSQLHRVRLPLRSHVDATDVGVRELASLARRRGTSGGNSVDAPTHTTISRTRLLRSRLVAPMSGAARGSGSGVRYQTHPPTLPPETVADVCGNLALLPASTLDPARVDALIQFILAVAGQQDEPRERELGPIHLLKYVYLADLAHADARGGETYTGARWQFYDFGPWSHAVLARVDPACAAAGGERKTLTSARYGDFVRYSLVDERLLDRLDAQLPSPVVSTVRWAMREFGTDTPALLRHAYMTGPMLRAAPGEFLVFERDNDTEAESARAAGSREQGTEVTYRIRVTTPPDEQARRALKQRKKIATRLRQEVRRRLEARAASQGLAAPTPPPRYDETFFDGVAWLDEQAGEPVRLSEGELEFSPEIWKSRGRHESGDDVP
jgi:hypothetical protein